MLLIKKLNRPGMQNPSRFGVLNRGVYDENGNLVAEIRTFTKAGPSHPKLITMRETGHVMMAYNDGKALLLIQTYIKHLGGDKANFIRMMSAAINAGRSEDEWWETVEKLEGKQK